MAHHGRYGKYTNLIYMLLAIAAVEFIALGSLLAVKAPVEEETAPPPAAETADPSAPPDWLLPQEPAQEPSLPEPVPAEKLPPANALTAADILADSRIIAHALGSIDGITTLNCLEGFQAKYEQGVRVFETDLRLTSDLQVVLRHDWRADWQDGVDETAIPTLEEFLAQPVLGKYTPMSFRDLLELMEAFPDICIVTDTKFVEPEMVTVQFQAMVADAEALGLSYLFDRMAIQIYSPLMFQVVEGVHQFPNYIYTLYASGFLGTEEAFIEKADFCVENGILGVTMWDHWWRENFAPLAQERDLLAFVHTVNDPEAAQALLDTGIHAVYTDTLVPGDLAEGAAPGAEHSPISQSEGETNHGTD